MSARWLEVTQCVAVVLAVIWFVAFYFTNKEAIQLSWTVGLSTPNSRASTTCFDMYAPGDSRLKDCEFAGPGSWADKYLAQQRGERVLWRYYADENHRPSVWLWWFGVPLALLVLKPLLAWVLRPLRKRTTGT